MIITVDGVERWFQFASNLGANIGNIVNAMGEGVAEEVKEHIEAGTPVDTGKLASSWQLSGGGLSWVIENHVHYGYFVNYGHKQEVGRYVAKIQAALVREYIPGTYFVESAISSVSLSGKNMSKVEAIWNSL